MGDVVDVAVASSDSSCINVSLCRFGVYDGRQLNCLRNYKLFAPARPCFYQLGLAATGDLIAAVGHSTYDCGTKDL